jgi:hypothetical protein
MRTRRGRARGGRPSTAARPTNAWQRWAKPVARFGLRVAKGLRWAAAAAAVLVALPKTCG